MKKIIFMIGSLQNGGAERVISVLANKFIEKYEVHVVTIMENKIDYDLNDGIKYTYIMENDDDKHGINRNFVRIKNIRKYIKTVKPDVVVSFLWATNIVAIISCLFLKQRLILSERNDPKHEPVNSLARTIRNVLFSVRTNNYFVFQTSYAKQCFNKSIQKKSQIIFNPIKENIPERYEARRAKKIVCVARLVEEKNIEMLLRAFKKVIEKHPDYLLYLYGRGPLKEKLEEEAIRLKIEKNVIFKGFSKNVHEEIKDATMFVLPSNYEGISNAMLEAMALGIPTICTDCPAYGAREFIKDGENGYLVNVNDEKMLEERMLSIIENDAIQNKFSKEACKIVERINCDVICNQWEAFISSIS